mmetsp:Transcript_100905/g.263088  ORF Transcript_100905/g.263088 Transcript_100905/m.263088 type:complete len:221 (-) Transcript_100905:1687-2349(-)
MGIRLFFRGKRGAAGVRVVHQGPGVIRQAEVQLDPLPRGHDRCLRCRVPAARSRLDHRNLGKQILLRLRHLVQAGHVGNAHCFERPGRQPRGNHACEGRGRRSRDPHPNGGRAHHRSERCRPGQRVEPKGRRADRPACRPRHGQEVDSHDGHREQGPGRAGYRQSPAGPRGRQRGDHTEPWAARGLVSPRPLPEGGHAGAQRDTQAEQGGLHQGRHPCWI